MNIIQNSYRTNTYHPRLAYISLALATITSLFIVGCASQSEFGTNSLSDLEGKWYWKQDPWYGYFVLHKKGNSYTGTLDDIFEGTYGDLIKDVEISKNEIKFTRDGSFGIQNWEGTLIVDDGLLKITDGRWTKRNGISGSFYAEKRD